MVRSSSVSSGTPPQLPSLDVDFPSGNGVAGNAHSASLRGNYHNKVPEIANQPLHTLLPILKDGRVHPEPYYITQNVVLKVPDGRPPWADSSRAQLTKSVSEMFCKNDRFRNDVMEELIKDCLHMEVAGIVSATFAEHKAQDREGAAIHAWLEDNVVTDTVYMATEDIVWEALWDQARKLKKKEIEDLETNYSRKKGDSHMLNLLREHYTQPLNYELGQSVLNHKWSELLYHTNRYMQRGSLMENYAIRKMQEQIICQIAAKVLLDESLKCVEQEMTSLDEEERIDRPPKKIETTE